MGLWESDRDYGMVWARLHIAVVDYKARDVMYLMLHNKLPVRERLFRIRLRPDPYCQTCVGAEISDVEHYFCSCEGIVRAWSWVKSRVGGLVGQQQGLVDWDLLNLFFPSSSYEMEIIWLVSSYVMYVWDTVYVRGVEVKLEQFFGFLTYKYREHQSVSNVKLKHLDRIT